MTQRTCGDRCLATPAAHKRNVSRRKAFHILALALGPAVLSKSNQSILAAPKVGSIDTKTAHSVSELRIGKGSIGGKGRSCQRRFREKKGKRPLTPERASVEGSPPTTIPAVALVSGAPGRYKSIMGGFDEPVKKNTPPFVDLSPAESGNHGGA